MNKSAKKQFVTSLKDSFSKVSFIAISHYSGLSVAEMTRLRREIRGVGAGLRVTQNRLTKIALQDSGFDAVSYLFKGPTVVAYSSDPVSAAKVVVEFARKNDKFILIGAIMDKSILDVESIKSLALLPSLDVLRGQLLGIIQAPATRLAGILQAPASQLARVISAYSELSNT